MPMTGNSVDGVVCSVYKQDGLADDRGLFSTCWIPPKLEVLSVRSKKNLIFPVPVNPDRAEQAVLVKR